MPNVGVVVLPPANKRKRSGSNRQPSHRQCDALPIELLFQIKLFVCSGLFYLVFKGVAFGSEAFKYYVFRGAAEVKLPSKRNRNLWLQLLVIPRRIELRFAERKSAVLTTRRWDLWVGY